MSTPPNASIRPYKPQDEKQVRFMIAQAQMEQLAFANNLAYFHPVTLAVWIAISSIFAQVMNWWPDPSRGFLGYLQILPAFFAPAVPLMFFIDLRNRPVIEDKTEVVLRRVDMLDLSAYYTRSPASGLWILEFDGNILGVIALDASKDALNDEPIGKTKFTEQQRKQVLHGKGTSSTVTIRHFFMEEAFRASGVEEDMLQFAVRAAFERDRAVSTVRILVTTLRPTVKKSVQETGFVPGEKGEKYGIFKWVPQWYTIDRPAWEANKKKLAEKAETL